MNPLSDEVNPYLEQEVYSASPLRLRWMLIRRAEELCGEVRRLWELCEDDLAANWLLRIREILGELLDGVQDEKNPVSQPVADFYVFLLQLLSQAEAGRDPDKVETLRELLSIENETWRMVIQKLQTGADQPETSSNGQVAALNLLTTDWNSAELTGGLNLEL